MGSKLALLTLNCQVNSGNGNIWLCSKVKIVRIVNLFRNVRGWGRMGRKAILLLFPAHICDRGT